MILLALDLAGKLAKAHSAQTSGLFIITTFTLESKAALGLVIPMNSKAARKTTNIEAEFVLDASPWDLILCKRQGNPRPLAWTN